MKEEGYAFDGGLLFSAARLSHRRQQKWEITSPFTKKHYYYQLKNNEIKRGYSSF
jgi:hypothetical protein